MSEGIAYWAVKDKNEKLKARIIELEAALRQIADQDYRGNRPPSAEIAYRVLHPKIQRST
jgi:hypothetical protein